MHRDCPRGPYGRWDLELVSVRPARLTPIARATAEVAFERFAVPGVIHDDLQPEILTITADSMSLQFQWKQNPVRFAVTRALPQAEDDLRSPADSPRAWVGYSAMDWCEDLSTGWTRWGRGRRRNGVIQLGRRTTERTNGLYGQGGRRSIQPDADGNVHVQHGSGLAMDTVTTYPGERFISCIYELRAPDDRHSHPLYVAHAVTVWTADPGIASLEIIDALPGVPEHSIRRAVLHAIHDAADDGAYKIVTNLDTSLLSDMGFVNHAHGQRVLDVLVMP